MSLFDSALLQRCQHLLDRIYHETHIDVPVGTLAKRLLETMRLGSSRYDGASHDSLHPCDLWDQSSTVMITYGDSFLSPNEKPLITLKHFLDDSQITDQIKTFLTYNYPKHKRGSSLLKYICMYKIHTNSANTFFICIAWSRIKSVGIEVQSARSEVTIWRVVILLVCGWIIFNCSSIRQT